MTSMLVPLAIVTSAGVTAASADPSRLSGVVSLPDTPGAAAILDVSALDRLGAPVRTFTRAIADATGTYTLRIPAEASLRLLSERTHGLNLRVAVTDLAPNGPGVEPAAYAATLTGKATLSRPSAPQLAAVADQRRRAAATLIQVALTGL